MRRLGLAVLVALVPAFTQADPSPPPSFAAGLCSEGARPEGKTDKAVALRPGFGAQRMAIRTSSAKAQAFFDNGLQLGQAFAHQEAVAAFEEAARQDPTCAMCLWGQAWAGGSTLNFSVDDKTSAKWAELMVRAKVLAADGPQKERDLIAAMILRYAKDGGDVAYGKAMDALTRTYPDDLQIAVLAADALMIPVTNNKSRDGLAHANALLENVLEREPSHAGAIHFYIHGTEIDGKTAKAETYADTLGGLAPDASHLAHMPSHTFYWVGRYRDAYRANAKAARLDALTARERALSGDWPAYTVPYHTHNVMFGAGGAMMSGDGAGALDITRPILPMALSAPAKDQQIQRLAVAAYAAQGRYGDIDQVLALPEPSADKPLLRVMRRYARGEALARRGDAAGVRREAEAMKLSRDDETLLGDGAKRAKALTQMAALILRGRAELLDGQPRKAIKAYRKAAELDEKTFGDHGDPPGWWYPVRRSLAAAQLADGDAAAAAASARATLNRRPLDPVALHLLAQAERAAGQTQLADQHAAQAREGWVGDLAKLNLANS
jgi:tetratricopeptide (TPR) repeat protein